MLKRRYCMIMLLILLAGLFSISLASAGNNLMADDMENNSLEMNVEDDDFYNLKELIDYADLGDTVELNQDYKSYGDNIGIYNSITIDGKGHTLDGAKSSGIFYISADNVVVKNTVFKNGVSQEGSAISWYGNNGILINCTFISNSATYDGGAIYCNGNNISIMESTFIGNSAELGGAVYISSNGDVQITSCNFNKNNAVNGGAVDWQGPEGIVRDCNFTSNEAKYGGAVMWIGDNGLLTGCNFISNSATYDGGAIYWESQTGTISKSSFKKNTAEFGKNIESEGEVTLSELNFDDKTTLKLSVSGNYYKSSALTVKHLYSDNTGVENSEVKLKFSNGETVYLYTNSKGTATYQIPFAPGTYSVKATVEDEEYVSTDAVTLKNIKIQKAQAKLAPTKLSTGYASGKCFQIKVTNTNTKKAMSGVKLKLKVFTGKKYKTVSVTTNSKGVAKYSASTLSIGTHKVIVENGDKKYVSASSKTSSIKITKASLKIDAPKVSNRYKGEGKFTVTVKNKASGATMKNVKVILKVYTGSKYKTYNLKTNAKGQASISTKSLSNGNHKVVVNVKSTANYKAAKANSVIGLSNKKITTTINVKVYNYYFNDFGDFNAADLIVILKDESGKTLNKKIEYHCNSRIYWGSDDIEYHGTLMSNEDSELSIAPGSVYRNSAFGYIDFEFKGDSTYESSSYRLNLI